MFEKYKQFDDLAISFIESVCHKIQRLFSINNFLLAKIVLLASVIMGMHPEHSSDLLLGILQLVIGIILVFVGESSVKYSAGSASANSLRSLEILSMVRLVNIVFSFVYLTVLLADPSNMRTLNDFVFTCLRWLFHLLVVCTPLPPGISMLREWLENPAPSKLTPVKA